MSNRDQQNSRRQWVAAGLAMFVIEMLVVVTVVGVALVVAAAVLAI